MPPVLVTGASGFLGWHVARALEQRGQRTRLLLRPSSKVNGLEGEIVRGDLRDPASLNAAVAGCSTVFHVAADYRLWAKDPNELYASNLDGTRNLMLAAWQARVERFVYTSTVGCIGIPPSAPGDESTPVSLEEMSGHYKRSKFLAEQFAVGEARRGRPVVVVNPTAPVGDHDVKPTPTGKIILDFLRGGMPAFVDTGLNLVDVRDCALGHLLAAERGLPGERYILGAENLTLQQILQRLAPLCGRPAPTVRIPYPAAYSFGVLSTGWAHLTGHEPRAPLEGVRMARKKMWVSHDKATRDLGFQPQPVGDALARAVAWFRDNGYC
jgi:dihydroflavonol-4-reductase